MKKFLIIFAIVFSGIVVSIGGYLGVKFLKGDFQEKVVAPESIYFELSKYEVTDDFKMKIVTPTEGVTKTLVYLKFSKDTTFYECSPTEWTDSVIVIPKQVKIGEFFDVKLAKTSDAELGGLEWIKGGISELVATSEVNSTGVAETTVYVDVPVHSTELVILEGEKTIPNGLNGVQDLAYLENKWPAVQGKTVVNKNSSYYVGLKYLPARSAVKYSKLKTNNFLSEYYNEIVTKANNLGVDISEELNNLNNALNTNPINIDNIVNAYISIVNCNKNAQFAEYLNSLKAQFNNNLKYNVLANSSNQELSEENKVDGFNLTKFTATETGTDSYYSYTFTNAEIEKNVLGSISDDSLILTTLNQLIASQAQNNKMVLMATSSLETTEVVADTVTYSGSINDFYANTLHTIYASKIGENNESSSYLNVKLINKTMPNVDLTSSLNNLAIRFLKQVSATSWVDAGNSIKFVDAESVNIKVKGNTYTYYKPSGSSVNFWQVYADNKLTEKLKAEIIYIVSDDKTNNDNDVCIIAQELTADFKVLDDLSSEQMVSWSSLDDLGINIIKCEKETTSNAINLQSLVSIPEINRYQTYKFFLYSSDVKEAINTYFDVLGKATYSFNGLTYNLYELNGSTLKLKNNIAPTFDVNVMFATIRTNAFGQEIKAGSAYSFAKYSAVKLSQSVIETLSSLSVDFNESLESVTSELEVNDPTNNDNAGKKDKSIKVLQNSRDVLKITIKSNQIEDVINAINDKTLKLVVKDKDSNIYYNILSYEYCVGTPVGGETEHYLLVSTGSIDQDIVDANIIFEYTFNNRTYIFDVDYPKNDSNPGNVIDIENISLYKNRISEISLGISDNINNTDGVVKVETIASGSSSISFTQSYTYEYKDETTGENKSETANLWVGNKLNVELTNFLGEKELDASNEWSLATNNPEVITITADGQSISFTGNQGQCEISLYLNGTLIRVLKFDVVSNGYVSQYSIYSPATNTTTEVFTLVSPYVQQTISIIVNGSNSHGSNTQGIILNDIFGMKYNIGGSDYDIPFTVSIADADTATNLNAITATNTYAKDQTITEFTLNKNLGSIVSLNFVYKNDDLNFSQIVNINLNPVIYLTDLTVSGAEINERGEYKVYAAKKYDVEFKVYNYTNSITFNSRPVSKDTSSPSEYSVYKTEVTFDDVIGTVPNIYRIQTGSAVGDLKYDIVFNVTNSLQVVDVSPIETLTSGSTTISLKEILKRIFDENDDVTETSTMAVELTSANGSNGGEFNVAFTTDSKGLTITQTGGFFIDNTTITLKIKVDSQDLHTWTVTLKAENIITNKQVVTNYNGQKAIVLVNGNDYSTDIIKAYFDPSKLAAGTNPVVVNSGITSYLTADGKISNSGDNVLLKDTGVYATVTDATGNKQVYLLVISKLKFPFVKLNEAGNCDYTNLDIYKLFVEISNQNRYEYYKNNNLFVELDDQYNLNITNLVNGNVINSSNYGSVSYYNNINKPGNATLIKASADNGTAWSANNILLNVGPVGELCYATLELNVAQSTTGASYVVRVMVKLDRTQQLTIDYNYGQTDVTHDVQIHNDQYMSVNHEVFNSNYYFDYYRFVSNECDINMQQIVKTVKKLNAADVFEPENYQGGFTYSVEKITQYIGGVWTEVAISELKNYYTYNDANQIFTFKQGALDKLRAKIKITCTNGGAFNYYYVSIGDKQNFTLQLTNNGVTNNVSTQQSITVNPGDTISIGQNNTSTFFYGLVQADYNGHLNYRVLDVDGKVLTGIDTYVTVNNKTLTIKALPNGGEFKLEIYTVHGLLTTITVTVNPYFTYELKNEPIYSGTKYNFGDIFTLKQWNSTNKAYESVSDAINIEEEGTNDGYNKGTTTDEEGNIVDTIDFDNLLNINQTTLTLNLKVTVNSYDYYINQEVTVYQRFKFNDATSEFKGLNIIDSSGVGTTTIYGTGLSGLLVDNAQGKTKVLATEVYTLKNGNDSYAASSGNFTRTEIVLSQKSVKMTYALVDSGNVICQTTITVVIYPNVAYTINYSFGLNKEYFQKDDKSSIGDKTIDGKDRISKVVYKADAHGNITPDDPVLAISDCNINVSAVTASGEASVKFNGVEFTKYYYEVSDANPISVTLTAGSEIYYGYEKATGSTEENLLSFIDVYLTLPNKITKSDNTNVLAGEKITLQYYGFDSSGSPEVKETISVYYRDNEKIRWVLPIADYHQNAYAMVDGVDDLTIKLDSQKPRVTLSYNGSTINDFSLYGSIISGKFEAKEAPAVGEEFKVSYSSGNCKSEQSEVFDIVHAFDISVNNGTDKKKPIEFTANSGVFSFTDTFNINSALGANWLNSKYVMSVSFAEYIDEEFSVVNNVAKNTCITVEPRENADQSKWDYTLKPNGALNNGTYVKITITFTYGTGTSAKTISADVYIKVLPNLVVSLLNSDKTQTYNTKDQPYKILLQSSSATDQITLVDSTLNLDKANNYEYHVYTYINNSTSTNNIAQNLSYSLGGDVANIAISKDSSGSLKATLTGSGFGDKNITVGFSDNYGYKFTYYIKIIAGTSINSHGMDNNLTIYEGYNMPVYNKFSTTPKTDAGYSFVLWNNSNDAVDKTLELVIKSAELKIKDKQPYKYEVDGSIKDTTVFEVDNNNQIKFKYLNYGDFWGDSNISSNGTSIVGDFTIVVHPTSGSETYTATFKVTINKQYVASIDTQDLFIRDGTSVDWAQYINVHDNKANKDFAKPELSYDTYLVFGGENNLDLSNVNTNVLSKEIVDDLKLTNISSLQGGAETKDTFAQYMKFSFESDAANNQANFNTITSFLDNYNIICRTNWDEVSKRTDNKNKLTITDFALSLTYKAELKQTGNSNNKIIIAEILAPLTSLTAAQVDVALGAGDIYFGGLTSMDTHDYTISYEATGINSCYLASTKDEIKVKVGGTEIKYTPTEKITANVKYALSVYSHKASIIYITADDVVEQISLTAGNNYKLLSEKGTDSNYFVNKTIKIYNGYVGTDLVINGFTSANAKLAKNLVDSKVDGGNPTYYDNDNSKQILTQINLSTVGDFKIDSITGIKYKEGTAKNIRLHYDNNTATVSNADTIEIIKDVKPKITLRYIDIDISKACSGGTISYVYVDSSKLDAQGKMSVSLEEWSKGYELIRGQGVSGLYSNPVEGDESFVWRNPEGALVYKNLTFTLSDINSASYAQIVENNDTSELGKITIGDNYVYGINHIAIDVSVVYPYSDNSTTTEHKAEKIGTVYVCFVLMENPVSIVFKEETTGSGATATTTKQFMFSSDYKNTTSDTTDDLTEATLKLKHIQTQSEYTFTKSGSNYVSTTPILSGYYVCECSKGTIYFKFDATDFSVNSVSKGFMDLNKSFGFEISYLSGQVNDGNLTLKRITDEGFEEYEFTKGTDNYYYSGALKVGIYFLEGKNGEIFYFRQSLKTYSVKYTVSTNVLTFEEYIGLNTSYVICSDNSSFPDIKIDSVNEKTCILSSENISSFNLDTKTYYKIEDGSSGAGIAYIIVTENTSS